MVILREVMSVTYTMNTGWVNVHCHEEDDQGSTWAKDYQLSDTDLTALAAGDGRSAWDDRDITLSLDNLYPLS